MGALKRLRHGVAALGEAVGDATDQLNGEKPSSPSTAPDHPVPAAGAEALIDKEVWLKVSLRVDGRQAPADDFEGAATAFVQQVVAAVGADHSQGMTLQVLRVEPTTDPPGNDSMEHA